MNEPFKAPVVDSLSVRVIVDSVFDQFMPKAIHPMCTIEHVGRIRHNLNSTLAGEWGLSLHLESQTDGATAQYLLDFGYTPESPNSDAFARTRARTFRGVSGYARNLEQTRPSFQNEARG